MTTPDKTLTLHVRIDASTKAQLAAMTKIYGLNASELVRALILHSYQSVQEVKENVDA